MGFEVRASKRNVFTVLYVEYSPRRTARKVPPQSYPAHGFRHDMSLDEARARASQLNLQASLDKRKAVAAARRVQESQLIDAAYLPKAYLVEFEDRFLPEQTEGSAVRLRTLRMQWSRCKKLIMELEAEPKDFCFLRKRLYKRFEEMQFSVDYAKQLIRLLNLWGAFYSRKTNTFFEPIPKPRGLAKERLVEAREGKRGVRTDAKPLTPDVLARVHHAFESEGLVAQWRWLYVSLWLGLRPEEVDRLANPTHTEWHKDHVRIYQSKLRSVPRAKRWKVIPFEFQEQREAAHLAQGGTLKRPLTKTLTRLLGDGFGNYSGRKGFADLMLERGYSFESVSLMLGHQNIDQTYRAYKDKQRIQKPKF